MPTGRWPCSAPRPLRVSRPSRSRRICARTFPDVHVTELARRAEELREAGEMAGIEIQVVSGAEVSLVWALEASEEQLALATYDQGGTDLLIETPTFNVVGLESLLYRLRAKGLRVTLAHPERSVPFQRDPSRLAELVRQGVLLQVNADAADHGTATIRHASAGPLPMRRGSRPRAGVRRASCERLACCYPPRRRRRGGGDAHRPRPGSLDDPDRAGGHPHRRRAARRAGPPGSAADAQAPRTTVRKSQLQTNLAHAYVDLRAQTPALACQCR